MNPPTPPLTVVRTGSATSWSGSSIASSNGGGSPPDTRSGLQTTWPCSRLPRSCSGFSSICIPRVVEELQFLSERPDAGRHAGFELELDVGEGSAWPESSAATNDGWGCPPRPTIFSGIRERFHHLVVSAQGNRAMPRVWIATLLLFSLV